jgi:hypothetical protein
MLLPSPSFFERSQWYGGGVERCCVVLCTATHLDLLGSLGSKLEVVLLHHRGKAARWQQSTYQQATSNQVAVQSRNPSLASTLTRQSSFSFLESKCRHPCDATAKKRVERRQHAIKVVPTQPTSESYLVGFMTGNSQKSSNTCTNSIRQSRRITNKTAHAPQNKRRRRP